MKNVVSMLGKLEERERNPLPSWVGNSEIITDIVGWLQAWADANPEESGCVVVKMSHELLATIERRGIDLPHALLRTAMRLGFEDVKVRPY